MAPNKNQRSPCCLPEDLIVEIFSHLPYKSLCRFKCVSKSCLAFSSHPNYRKKLPQDLAGLLYHNLLPCYPQGGYGIQFASAGSSNFPGLGFLPCGGSSLRCLDCCNGLLLCSSGSRYYVCNPATGYWILLPEPECGFRVLALAFDRRAASDGFHVLNFARTEAVRREFLDDDDAVSDGVSDGESVDLYDEEDLSFVNGLEVFSSETGRWTPSRVGWGSRVRLVEGAGSVFVNGIVHLLTYEKMVIAIDPEGRACDLICLPGPHRFGLAGCLGHSLGSLHYAVQEDGCISMQIWVLKDYDRREWVLKHRFKIEITPGIRLLFDYVDHGNSSDISYVVVFHPERDIVFLPVEGYALLSYNLTNGELNEVCKLCPETRPKFLVYVPSYVDFFQS